MTVRLYVEGGGDSTALRTRCREAFAKLLERSGFEGRLPRIVECGSRNDTFDAFRTAQRRRAPDECPILLVDSEAPVALEPWEHLKARDNWDRPIGAAVDQAQLMVACMETWIMADRAALRRVFGQALRESALFPVDGLEAREKDAVQQRLEDATRECGPNRGYRQGRRSFEVLRELDPGTRLGNSEPPRLPHFKRLVDTLEEKLPPVDGRVTPADRRPSRSPRPSRSRRPRQ